MSWVLNDAPPKFGAELAECRRYYIPPGELLLTGVFVGGAFYGLLPVQMRANATPINTKLGSLAYNGTTCSVSSVGPVEKLPNGMKFVVRVDPQSAPPNNTICIWKSNSIGLNCDL